jgi:RNA polymerase sigma-70 factor (ECF subfamily)
MTDRQCYDGDRGEKVTVHQDDWLAEQFQQHRSHLRAVAMRVLGSSTEADDAVQESWLRLSRSDADAIENLGGWLTTVVARVSLDMLRSRATRREHAGTTEIERHFEPIAHDDPEAEAVLADSLGSALLVVLGSLAPAERLAFVLHDMFAVPFDQIGEILHRSPNAAKQLASRARQRLQGTEPAADTDVTRQREVVGAFLAASRGGDFEALLAVLDPDVVLRADPAGVQMGAAALVRGAAEVAGTFSGRALGAEPVIIDGTIGLMWAPGGHRKVVWELTIIDGTITRIDMIATTQTLDELDLVPLNG